jgi:hypothetical protein
MRLSEYNYPLTQTRSCDRTTMAKRSGSVRMALGLAQMIGAILAILRLLQHGLDRLFLITFALTTLATLVSIYLFRGPGSARQPGE